jgi:hypothetical protein
MDRTALENMRWPVCRVKEYMKSLGIIKGVNYVPAYCYSYIEIWHHYNEEVILRELNYAKEIGINSMRIFVSTAQWQSHRMLVYENLDRFLNSCKERGISIMLSLVAGACIKRGYVQQRTDPMIINFRPGIHDKSWAFEGVERDAWRDNRQTIKDFVRDIVTRYAADDRVAILDLYNEAPKDRIEVVNDVFEVAREVNPMQPLTACWEAQEISDVVTFHCYAEPNATKEHFPKVAHSFENEVNMALAEGRPTLCTECLGRTIGNELEKFLPIFAEKNIGFYVWGLCEGSAQYRIPWHWPEGSPEPKRWFHSLLYPDGTPYDESEIPLIKNFTYKP